MYQLYSFPFSQHSRRVISLLEQAGIEYENHQVDMINGEHMQAAYLAINPNHQVPTLIDSGTKIHESNAILRYLCIKHELSQWYPQQPDLLARVEQWLDWTQCQLSPLVIAIVLNRVFLGDDGDKQAADEAAMKIQSRFGIMESYLAGTQFLAGDTPTIADLALASSVFQLSLADASPQTPNILRWYQAVEALPGFQKSLPKT
ncbi:glutathione S-transferase family protein [Bowmanella dokdonensis]|uniref:Glutathione S-transferase family protein n=1 Tax=Bowmanella dokdonensis TaxID=751969 RepID=A0A939IPA1_9ALTE|nr:glutathione S-transferase family protein [Bowmanella dokdonensis]MBN7825690.1 glutathione S-transferase family protein [Bowmanella dokdonensis]